MHVVPYESARIEYTVSNSRFMASLSPASTVEDARAFIAGIKKEFADATHNVPAFVVGGEKSSVEFCSDDGEPSGTSGRPLLAVLKGSGLRDCVIVVTRYFGGTLLGTGGLVKAYSEGGKLVCQAVRRAQVLPGFRVSCEVPYGLFERARQFALDSKADALESSFTEHAHLVFSITESAWPTLEARLASLASGQAKLSILNALSIRSLL